MINHTKRNLNLGWVLLFIFAFGNGNLLRANLYEDGLRAAVRLTTAKESGTGFFVKRGDVHLLITAAHVFNKMEGDSCTVVYRKAQAKGGGFERSEVKLAIRKGKKPLWKQHGELDIAMIEVAPPVGVDLMPLNYDQLGDEALLKGGKVAVGHDIFVPCFPAKVESNKAGWPILRRGSIASHPLLPLSDAKSFFIDTASFGGESGAPCLAVIDGKVRVVGVVYAMQRQSDKVVSPFLESTMHTPMGLGIVVQAPFLRNLIEGK